ncbi:MAG TPA: NPCBM/NEW2 domain-containing protein [Planctomycetota bacterium]|nr:NPCBM/NEW2 domain-containing protein [Planctomycetota bacterium]
MKPLALLVAVLGALLGPGVPPDGATLVTAGNSSINARELTLTGDGSDLVVKYVDLGGEAGTLKAADLVEIAFNGGRAASTGRPATDDVEVLLTTGDLLVGKVGAKSDDGINLISPVFSNPLVKFGQIRAVIFPVNRAFLPLRLPEKAETADIILTQSGDRAEGTLLTISDAGVVYKSKRLDKDVTVPLDKAAGVWMIETEAPPKEPAGLHATVLTSDGSSVRGEIQSLKDGGLTLKDSYGTVHKVPANLLSGIYMKNGRVVYLSDMKPGLIDEDANYIRGPKKLSSDLDFPYQRDRSAKGGKLILGGVEHRKGVGVRARSLLGYSLEGGFRRFQATLGLDAASLGLGAVRAQIDVDGKTVKEISLKGTEPPQAIDLDVSGAKELRLLITWAGFGQSDFADWGSARLIR